MLALERKKFNCLLQQAMFHTNCHGDSVKHTPGPVYPQTKSEAADMLTPLVLHPQYNPLYFLTLGMCISLSKTRWLIFEWIEDG